MASAAPAFAQVTVPAPPDFLETVSNDWFRVMYNPAADISMGQVMDDSAAAHQTIARFYGVYKYRTTLEIATTYDEYRLECGVGDVPEYIDGSNWNDGERGVIILKSPDMTQDFRKKLTYHMARIAERSLINETLYPPEWFSDGLASYIASDITEEDKSLTVTRLQNGKWKTPGELEQVYDNTTIYNNQNPEYKAVHAQAALLLKHAGTLYGNATLAQIVRDYAETGNLTSAFIGNTGRSPEDLNDDLKTHLLKQYTYDPTPLPKADEHVYGFVFSPSGQSLPGRVVTLSGNGTNVTAVTDENGYFYTNVNWGAINVFVDGKPAVNDTITVNPGEQKYSNITVTEVENATPPAPGIFTLPQISLDGSNLGTNGLILIVLANMAAIGIIIWILKRNYR